MKYKSLKNKINRRKLLLNFLLHYIKPNNKIILFLSQDLDKLIVKAQHFHFKKYNKKTNKHMLTFMRNVA